MSPLDTIEEVQESTSNNENVLAETLPIPEKPVSFVPAIHELAQTKIKEDIQPDQPPKEEEPVIEEQSQPQPVYKVPTIQHGSLNYHPVRIENDFNLSEEVASDDDPAELANNMEK